MTLEKVEEQFQLIADIAIDYDGYRKANDLMDLIDELRGMAIKGVAMVQEMEEQEKLKLFHKKCLCEID